MAGRLVKRIINETYGDGSGRTPNRHLTRGGKRFVGALE